MFFGCCFIICISISFNLFLLYRYLYFIATADGTAISSTNDTAAIVGELLYVFWLLLYYLYFYLI